MARTISDQLRPVVRGVLGRDPGITLRFWDGSSLAPSRAPAQEPASGTDGSGPASATIELRSPMALRRLLWAPNELGLARAYVAGDIDIVGDVYQILDMRTLLGAPDEGVSLTFNARTVCRLALAALQLGAIGAPPPPPPEEIRLRGRLHSPGRDAAAIRHHYDVSNDFYRLVLGPTLTYSCAYWDDDVHDLDGAQEAKYEHICRKLALRPGMRFLDVGCGWGGMVLHAARQHGVQAVGITLSPAQCELARARVRGAGLEDRVEIRLQDYRELRGETFDAISSIGMFEHVGEARLREYSKILFSLLRPEGRLLNHGISRPAGPSPLSNRGFINRYVFPDGELHEVGRVVSVLQESGFEVRDVESLREHYARTLRCWVANLEAGWDEAVTLVGPGRARVWRLYMAGSAVNFEEGRTMIHQVLGVRQGARGTSGMPATRRGWYYSPSRGGTEMVGTGDGGGGGAKSNRVTDGGARRPETAQSV